MLGMIFWRAIPASRACLCYWQILFFTWIWAVMLSRYFYAEYPRTQTAYEESLTIKYYIFEFVNTYTSLFYVAFFKGRWVAVSKRVCGRASRRVELQCRSSELRTFGWWDRYVRQDFAGYAGSQRSQLWAMCIGFHRAYQERKSVSARSASYALAHSIRFTCGWFMVAIRYPAAVPKARILGNLPVDRVCMTNHFRFRGRWRFWISFQCDKGGCLIELTIQLAVLYLGSSLSNFVMEIVVPSILRRLRSRQHVRRFEKRKHDQRWEKDYDLVPFPTMGLFLEYSRMGKWISSASEKMPGQHSFGDVHIAYLKTSKTDLQHIALVDKIWKEPEELIKKLSRRFFCAWLSGAQ